MIRFEVIIGYITRFSLIDIFMRDAVLNLNPTKVPAIKINK